MTIPDADAFDPDKEEGICQGYSPDSDAKPASLCEMPCCGHLVLRLFMPEEDEPCSNCGAM